MDNSTLQEYETIAADLIEDETVLRITLDHPKGNVLSMAMIRELSEALTTHQDIQQLRLVLLRAAGKHFSFGASVEEHRRDTAPAMLSSFHAFIRQLASYSVPVAALVQGSCLGGAFEVVLCCHFVFATSTAHFGCPEIKLGVFPPVLAALGSSRLGGPTAERLLLTGATLDAHTALALGFLTAVFDEDETPEQALLTWYRETIRPLSAFALRQGTRALRTASGFTEKLGESIARAEQQYVKEVLESHDGNEGIEAFIEKRSPIWKDR